MIVALASWAPPLLGRQCERLKKKNTELSLLAVWVISTEWDLKVSLHVQGKVVRPGKGPVALLALKGPVPCVFAVVPGQFIRAGEFPPTAVPVTVVRFLACVSPQVRLEMRTLRIGFATACIVTSVGGRSFPGPRPSSPLWLGLLWQAGTRWHEL